MCNIVLLTPLSDGRIKNFRVHVFFYAFFFACARILHYPVLAGPFIDLLLLDLHVLLGRTEKQKYGR